MFFFLERQLSHGIPINMSAAELGDLYDVFQLIHYSAEGNLPKIKEIIEKGNVNVNSSDYDRRCPLHLAASNGHIEVVEYLVEQGAEVNAEDRWKGTPLQDAMREKHDAVCKRLRSKGASVMDMRTMGEHLCKAAGSGDVSLLSRLLDNKADPNAVDYDRRSALHLAAAEGHLFCVEMLIDRGADPNLADRWGNTALLEAVNHKHDAISALLRQHGAKMIDQESSSQALLSAAGQGDVAAVRRLLDNGAKATAADYDKRTALHLACSEGLQEVAEILIGRGADVNAEDRWGGTPLAEALRNNNPALVKFLQSKGAKEVKLQGEDLAEAELAKRFPNSKTESKMTIEPQGSREDYAATPLSELMDSLRTHSEWPDFTAKALGGLFDIIKADDDSRTKTAEAVNNEAVEVTIAAMKNYPDHEEVQTNAGNVLWQIAFVDRFAPTILLDGGIRLLLNAIKNIGAPACKEAALSALANVTFATAVNSSSICREFVKDNGIKIALQTMRTNARNERIVQKSIECVWNVAHSDQENLERVKFDSGIDAVVFAVKTYKRSGPRIVESGVGCINALIQESTMCSVFVDQLGGLELVLEVLQLYKDEKDIVDPAVAIMTRLAVVANKDTPDIQKKDLFKQTLSEKKGIQPVVEAMKKYPLDQQLQENGALFLIKAARLYKTKKEKMDVLSKDCKKTISKAKKKHPKSDKLAVLDREVSVIEKEDCLIM